MPKNLARLVPGPDRQEKRVSIFFPKKSNPPFRVHHVKGQNGASTYARERVVLLLTLSMAHPVYVVRYSYMVFYLKLLSASCYPCEYYMVIYPAPIWTFTQDLYQLPVNPVGTIWSFTPTPIWELIDICF